MTKETDEKGHILLIDAAIEGDLARVNQCLDEGHNPTAVNMKGKSARDLALEGGFNEIAAVLHRAEKGIEVWEFGQPFGEYGFIVQRKTTREEIEFALFDSNCPAGLEIRAKTSYRKYSPFEYNSEDQKPDWKPIDDAFLDEFGTTLAKLKKIKSSQLRKAFLILGGLYIAAPIVIIICALWLGGMYYPELSGAELGLRFGWLIGGLYGVIVVAKTLGALWGMLSLMGLIAYAGNTLP